MNFGIVTFNKPNWEGKGGEGGGKGMEGNAKEWKGGEGEGKGMEGKEREGKEGDLVL